MAAPNLLAPTTITGKTSGYTVTTSEADWIVNASNSGQALKINTIRIANITGTAATVTVKLYSSATGGTATDLATAVSVAANSTYTVVSKDTPLWLEEDRRLRIVAGTATALHAVCSYEQIS